MKNHNPSLKLLIFSVLLLIYSHTVPAQQNEWILDSQFNTLQWDDFVEKAATEFKVQFFFTPSDFKEISLQAIHADISLVNYLKQNLEGAGIHITVHKNEHIFLYKGDELDLSLKKEIYQKAIVVTEMQKTSETEKETTHFLQTSTAHLGEILVIGNKKTGRKERKASLKGRLLDAKDQSPIFGASILVQELGIGTISDEKGWYTLKLNKGKYTLLINEITHTEQKINIHLLSSDKQDFFLEPSAVNLKGVVITADTYDNIKNTKMGFERLMTQSIKEIPLVMGERDILKVASLLPGIQSVGEGSGGFNVRGSPADQNLFYIDGIPIYNTSHFFGFFSVFNSDAIDEFSLYKGNIPAKFGGKLASIFDITAKEGNNEKFKIRGGISPITGRIMLEGPIKKGKSSFMLGLRSTYSDWVLQLIEKSDFKKSSAAFADMMAKFSFHINPKNKVQALVYYSFDNINFAQKSLYDIENQGASLRWNHFLNTKNNVNFSLVYSKYGLNTLNKEFDLAAYQQNNALQHKEAKVNVTLRPSHQHQIEFGTNVVLYQIDRGDFLPSGESSQIIAKHLGLEKGIEGGIFVSERWKPNARLTLIAGLRYNFFSYLGPQQSVYTYQEGLEKAPTSIVDTLEFQDNEIIKTYTGLDYRLGIKYTFNQNLSIKTSYNRLHQYIFLLSNTIALSPTDNWKLTDYNIRPMQGDQISFGVYSHLFHKKIALSLEGYYKKVKNLVEFKDGADLLANAVPEWSVLQGNLAIFGVEFMVKKSKGRFNGWVNYTYSSSSVLVNGDIEGEQINFGKPYPANHDKPHAFNIVANYKFRRRLSISANFVYATGKPITYPTSIYYQDGIRLINFTARNAYRVPDYFRADVSVKVEGNLKVQKRFHGTWVFSIYNLLSRHNVYNAYFKVNASKITGYKVSIFARPIFSVTYNFKFGNYDY